MSGLVDEPIEQGTRKRADYETRQRARLALNIERIDGSTLQIIVESDMRSHEEETEIQQNTFLAVLPMARLPGHQKASEEPKGALPRPGRIYIFRQGRLWREMSCDGQGNLADVDVADWRKRAAEGKPADDREPVGKPLSLTLVPMLLQGRFVGDQIEMAYSEMPWTWEYLTWLEADAKRVNNRFQNLASAWAAAVVGEQEWKPTQAMPAVIIAADTEGMRARDLHVECALQNPAAFTPTLAALDPDELLVQLHAYQRDLAAHMGSAAPEELPELPPGNDLLAEKNLRGYPKLIGFLLEDPLFELRHAVEQSRLACEALQTFNALVPFQPFGRYAEVLHQWSIPANAPLSNLRDQIDTTSLETSMLHIQRKSARDTIRTQLDRTLLLAQRKLPSIWNDWIYSNDERLLEPYSLLIDILEMLSRLPEDTDARSFHPDDRSLIQHVDGLVKQLAAATHPLTRQALPRESEVLPELAQRLARLAATTQPVNLQRAGISTLAMFAGLDSENSPNYQYAIQNVALAVDEWLSHLTRAVLLTLRKLRTNPAVVQIEMPRLFAPTLGLLSKLHTQARTIRFMPQGEALAQNMEVLGVHGASVSFGLKASDRTTLTRQNYMYSNLQGRTGNVLATTSGKLAQANSFASKDLGRLMVIAAPANDPLVRDLSSWQMSTANLDRAGSIARSPALPLLATVLAAYNLHVNTVGASNLLQTEKGRLIAGAASAIADLLLASNNVALKIIESSTDRSRWYALWEKGRIDASRLSNQWAANLTKRTGSSWLSISRAGSFVAMGVTSALFMWDAKRAFDHGDKDASIANAIAASGSAMWAFYTLGVLASPWVLSAGVILLLGGAIAAVLLADGAIEQAIKHGPFGIERRLPQMNDPLIAYQQLLGAIGAPKITIKRLDSWLEEAPEEDRAKFQSAARQAQGELEPLDWVVELRSGLLSQYPTDKRFMLLAFELTLRRSHGTGWQRRTPKAVHQLKLDAVVMDAGRVLYVLPSQNQPQANPYFASKHALKVSAQFRLGHQSCRADDPFPAYDDLVLPQPSPREWSAFNSNQVPAAHDVMGDTPYWIIEQSEYRQL
ncbi:hypothetical protein [Halopseudomonas salina]|uniref:Uncharacterized protein n=1 Tax=Halopseudomonas salina TaxID=1323744 RepID=A0ABQ1Q1K8_9GAMM|nr:hypothetical protein [Halopseudomonas salina]GGD09370.1 hypothetical protein GCM10007418_30530 [Halopseudomonas salina]